MIKKKRIAGLAASDVLLGAAALKKIDLFLLIS
jgi:hypothetical protein